MYIMKNPYTQRRKRIIICFDGTFDDTGDTPERTKPGSSVSRLCRWILPPLLWQIIWVVRIFAIFKWIELRIWPPKPKEKFVTNASLLASAIKPLEQIIDEEGATHFIHQMVFYIGGIGALGNPQSRLEEAVTGNTMTYKVRYGYRLLVDNHCDGDEIFLFGFSRGAFAARATADFIKDHGIFKKNSMARFDDAWTNFTRRGQPTILPIEGLDEAQRANRLLRKPIRCIGVWDTVGSLGTPPLFFIHRDDISTARAAHRRHGHFDVSSTPHADYAFHALALDERRFDFYPALWSFPYLGQANSHRFSQTWFPGVHTDVGGGNPGGLSQYALIWMISKIQENNLLGLDDEFIESAIMMPIKEKDIPPWNLAITGRDYIERLMPWLGFLPQKIKDLFRTAHRNPQMSATSINPQIASTPVSTDSAITAEKNFHWTVVERALKTDGKYWDSCPALRKRDPISLREPSRDLRLRMEEPIGKDHDLMSHFTSNTSAADT
ncbi:hypothetical protein K505DRAFT_413494 [Melanomma pulvis-pyrius CBS 109.77]|uniref:T6SS Phospholipase effector Tle1-like catalytic domain-containing protein n=1 Tax=Melanomma pulvis-pyrius CBS 109.77 TaxID=1314802 RepID=A0A6A6XU47_9PLEO|nr:hypothetical protein K505DRAFT_413494 [Melanomma pulvis-pyrius CBS 109.77]